MAVPIVYNNFAAPAIDAGNLNTVNNVVYTVVGDGTNAPVNAAQVRTNIGLGTIATQNANAVAITGGTIAGATITGGSISGISPPLATASGGNAVDMNTAWSSLSVGAITSVTGTITSANGTTRYRIVGKSVTFLTVINIVNNGTGAGGLNIVAALPVAPLITASYAGREQAVNGAVISAAFVASSTTITVQKYDNTYAGQTGAVLTISGTYESV